MRTLVIGGAFLVLSGCVDPIVQETLDELPDRAVVEFNGSSVRIESKSKTPNADDLALAQSVCPDARFQTVLSDGDVIGIPVREFLYVC